MNKKFLKDSLLWGFVLWLIGYILGFIFFAFVPQSQIGWYIMPLGTLITILVVYKFIKSDKLAYYFKVGLIWALTAVVFDYIFLVQLLKPTNGYYQLDVYLYYALTLLLPIIVGWIKLKK